MAKRATVQVVGFEEYRRRVQSLSNAVTTKKEKHQVLVSGGRIARDYAKNVIMKDIQARYVYKYYRKGQGQVAAVLPGNLRNSMYVFRHKTGEASIGPRVLRKINAGSILGALPKSSSGWYAHMIFKKANMFRIKVTDAAVQVVYPKMLKRMEKRYEQIFKKWQRRYNL